METRSSLPPPGASAALADALGFGFPIPDAELPKAMKQGIVLEII